MKLLFEERLKTMRRDPYRWLGSLGVAKGMSVVDLGAGKGLYSLVAAELVGGTGRVYAVEPDPVRAALIERRASMENLSNVRVMQTRAESVTGISDSTVDLALSLNALHHYEDRMAAFSEARRILKPGGRLYVRDILYNWMFRHGTRREEIPSLTPTGFSESRVNLAGMNVELTFTK